jgi:hypothetical protein
MLLHLRIVRVYPTCELVGSLRVRGRAGVNRVPFSGLIHGRPLSAGTYRLVIGPRQTRPTAQATIVVARGRVSSVQFRKARQANVCVPVFGFGSALPFVASDTGSGAGSETGSGSPVVKAAKGVAKKGKSLAARVKGRIQDPNPIGSGFLVLVGFLTLAAAALGAFVLVNAHRLLERLLR